MTLEYHAGTYWSRHNAESYADALRKEGQEVEVREKIIYEVVVIVSSPDKPV